MKRSNKKKMKRNLIIFTFYFVFSTLSAKYKHDPILFNIVLIVFFYLWEVQRRKNKTKQKETLVFRSSHLPEVWKLGWNVHAYPSPVRIQGVQNWKPATTLSSFWKSRKKKTNKKRERKLWLLVWKNGEIISPGVAWIAWETRRRRRRNTKTSGGDIKGCCCRRRRHCLLTLFWNGICYQMQISG